MALSTGSLLAGRYEITAPVAVGGMGEVWRARDRVLDRTVAAKVLRSEYTGDPNFLARFRNEARHTAALSHPNIASVYDYGETLDENGATVAYLVMEFVEGQTLVQILHEEGRLPVDWTLHVLGQAADGLSAAHRAGVVHRDIKPGNLIIRPDGVLKLTDFGIAQARDAAPLTRTGMVVGTAQYLSPEQAQGMEVAAASDVYSLGVVGYECLAGTRPFDGASQVAIALAHINRPPPPLPPDVSDQVAGLIRRALAKDPAERFPDGAAFAEAVRHVAAGGTLPGTGGFSVAAAPTEILDIPEDGGTRVLSGAAAGALATGAGPGGPGTRARPMPPLRGEPDDDGPGGYPAGDQPPPHRRWVWLIAGLVLLVAAGAVAWLLLGHSGADPVGSRQGGTTASTTVSSPSTLVRIDTNAFVGQDADAVQRHLEQAGLTVTQHAATTGQMRALGRALAARAVVGSNPANRAVPQGSRVVLFVAPRAFAPGNPGAATTTAAPTTHPRPTSTPTPPTTTTAPPTTPTTTTTATTTTDTATTTTAASGSELTSTSTAPPTTTAQAAGGGDGSGGGNGNGSP